MGWGGVGRRGWPIPDTVSYKVMATGADTTPDYLFPKLAAGPGISLAVLNPGANEQVQITNTASIGPGTTNYIPKWTAPTTLGDSVIYETPGGDIGIAETAPDAGFTVKKNIAFGNIQSWKANIIHPFTSLAEVDTFGIVYCTNKDSGGLEFQGYTDGIVPGIRLQAYQGIGGSTYTDAAIICDFHKSNGGTGSQALAAGEWGFSILNSGNGRFGVLGNGDTRITGTYRSDTLTATRLLQSNGTKDIISADLLNWIGAGPNITVVTDGAGGVTISSTGGGTVGPGTVNQVAKFTGANAVGDSRIADDATNVFINSGRTYVNTSTARPFAGNTPHLWIYSSTVGYTPTLAGNDIVIESGAESAMTFLSSGEDSARLYFQGGGDR